MSAAWPKYALAEVERRWLVAPDRLPPLGEAIRIEDRYIDGTRLRLRTVQAAYGDRRWKLTRKYGGIPPLEPITTIYLTEAEYMLFATLPAATLVKDRFHVVAGEHRFAVDRFAGRLAGLWLAEVEAASVEAVSRIVPPDWTTREVTDDVAYTGAALARGGH
ncbi:hypothetical protein [Sphingomonas sp. Leaf412]|uniref:hypothetical protein n=1 Tax=Sphingomonas sp. Leaf412 TaxID=1736370 RepID=UPI0012E3D59F|nr:hypothetical protein [Sphingomonas sp. Leaf412]